MRLILVRHGQTSSNVATLLDTAHPGADLNDLGRAQADALPDALDGTPIDAIYASSLVRAQQTAEPLAAAHGLEIRVRSGLREISAGALEMLGDAESIDSYLTTALAWGAGDLSPTIPGGEPGDAVLARFDEVVTEAAASGAETVVVVSHGIMIRTWATARSDVTPDFAAASRLANAEVVVLDGHPDSGWRALTWAGTPVAGGLPRESAALGRRSVAGGAVARPLSPPAALQGARAGPGRRRRPAPGAGRGRPARRGTRAPPASRSRSCPPGRNVTSRAPSP